jgi:hypothetical protein
VRVGRRGQPDTHDLGARDRDPLVDGVHQVCPLLRYVGGLKGLAQEVEERVQFNGMTWSQAPRSLAEASFEQAEVYKVIGGVRAPALCGRRGERLAAVTSDSPHAILTRVQGSPRPLTRSDLHPGPDRRIN